MKGNEAMMESGNAVQHNLTVALFGTFSIHSEAALEPKGAMSSDLNVNSKPKKRRSAAQPRWGWSGGAIIPQLRERTEMVRSIIERMPTRSSEADDLVDELL